MKKTCGLVFTLGITLVAAQGFAAQNSQSSTSGQEGSQSSGRAHPVAVEIVSVNPQANTITVREITAVPSSSGASSSRTLSMPSSSSGQLSQMRAGQRAEITCDVEPAQTSSGRPVMLADCLRITHIAPSNASVGTSGTGSSGTTGTNGSSSTGSSSSGNPNSGSSSGGSSSGSSSSGGSSSGSSSGSSTPNGSGR